MIALEINYQFFSEDEGTTTETESKSFKTMKTAFNYIAEIEQSAKNKNETYEEDTEFNFKILSIDYKIRVIY